MLTELRNTERCTLMKIITPTALILIDGDVVKTYMHPDVEFSAESSEENISMIWEHIKDKRIFNLLAPDATTQITIDVRHYENAKLEGVKVAEAIVIRSLAHRILGNAYVAARKRHYPVQLFETEEEALSWFDTLR